MIHIAPWAAAEALFQGAGEHLANDGVLFLYGPYKRDGAHTAPATKPSTTSFAPPIPPGACEIWKTWWSSGVQADLWMEEAVPMPANNFCLIFKRARI